MLIEINGSLWRIQAVDGHNKLLVRSDGVYTLGVTDNNVKTIYIKQGLSEHMFDKVLCHELTHAYAFEYGYFLDIKTEEIVADFMSLYGRKIVYMADEIIRNVLRRAL